MNYINNMFAAAIANRNGLVRRKIRNVRRYASFAQLENEVRRRGFHLMEVGDQYVVICNPGNVRLVC